MNTTANTQPSPIISFTPHIDAYNVAHLDNTEVNISTEEFTS